MSRTQYNDVQGTLNILYKFADIREACALIMLNFM